MNGLEGWLLHWLNGWVARSPASFDQALFLTDRMPWLLAAGVLAGLWFFGEPGAVPTQPGGLTRLESRGRILLMLLALAISFLLTAGLQELVFRPRPLVDTPLEIPVNPEAWQVIRDNLASSSSFPSYQAVLFLVIATTIFSLNRYVGGFALFISGYFEALEVGLGFHWPLDGVAGALIGVLVASLLLASKPVWGRTLQVIALEIEHRPKLTYVLGFLILFDLSQKFVALSGLLNLVYSH